MLLFAATISLFSCSSLRGNDKPESLSPVYVTDDKPVSVLPPRCMKGSLDTMQLFTGSFGDKAFTAWAYIQADQEGLTMLFLNDMAIDMGTLSYRENTLSFSSPYIPKNIKAEYILLDIQNVYYDFDSLAELYDSAGLSFTSSVAEGNRTYLLKDGDTIIEEIVSTGTVIRIQNFLRGYSYELKLAEEDERL